MLVIINSFINMLVIINSDVEDSSAAVGRLEQLLAAF